jgi:hypothetical protein
LPKLRTLLLITVGLFATVFLWLLAPLFTAVVAIALLSNAMTGAYRRTFPRRRRELPGLTLPADGRERVGVKRA